MFYKSRATVEFLLFQLDQSCKVYMVMARAIVGLLRPDFDKVEKFAWHKTIDVENRERVINIWHLLSGQYKPY